MLTRSNPGHGRGNPVHRTFILEELWRRAVGAPVVPRRRFRRWLGRRFGLDEAGGDRIARRITHCLGALLLIYFVLPENFFVIAPKEVIVLAALVAACGLEALRHAIGFDLPMIRPYEEHRIASFVFYSVALAGAVLLFPVPIAAAVILGTALVDPIAGEIRLSPRYRSWYPAVPFVVYWPLALVGLSLVGGWPVGWGVLLALVAAVVGLAAEYPKIPWVDDDLAMTFAPALVLYGLGVLGLGLHP